MKLDYIKHIKQKRELLSIVLFSTSVLFAVLILIKVTGFFTASAKAENLVQRGIANGQLDPKEVEKHLAESKAIADELKKNNLFAPPPPKQHPVKQVSGIFGDEVLINGKWYKAGDKVGDAKIVAIEPTQVKIKWDGKEKVFDPFSGAVAAATPAPKQGAQKRVQVRRMAALPGKAAEDIVTFTHTVEAPFILKEGRDSTGSVRKIILRGADPSKMSNDSLIIRADPSNMPNDSTIIRFEKKD